MRYSPACSRYGPAAALVLAHLVVPPAAADPPGRPPVDFNRDVRPILSNNCFACHGPDEKERKGDLRLDTPDGIAAAVTPGKPGASELLKRVKSSDRGDVMPPPKTGKTLTPAEVKTLTEWVESGAAYATHWAYTKPVRPPVPAVAGGGYPVKNPVDAFLAARLRREGLAPSPPADRHALLRRVTLDLTGLPPTPEDVDAFLRDAGPDAYDRLVDRLLARPAFGEHWARLWLDLARYADSAGYADDPPRTIWKYRDYVIQSLNANKPFDRFTVEQLAGDLLPDPTDDHLAATAFHRNTLTNNEGGTNDEEFRNVAVVDRVNTTFTVWMGTSMGCCQCHTHKFDPLTQTEYFRAFAVFNNTADADRGDESPTLPFWEPAAAAKKQRLEAALAAAEGKRNGPAPGWLTRARITGLKKELATVKPATTVPVLRELPAGQRRKTRLQFRGNFLDLGDEVTEGTPAVFPPLPAGAPVNRLTFARWLVGPDNPLTARVVANRFWEQIFGVGIVRTSEEFGAQGELPSHPELLDWLAVELSSGPAPWDVKAFLKLLVTSAAYRQSSRVTPEAFERDPENRLLARGPRVRLTAEAVRDQALAVAGLLSPKMYGPSVRPPQPSLGVSAAFGGSIDWQPSAGEDKFRRGVYTVWRRSNPYPSMSTFDAPNRDICVVRRARTNTPLQALVTMNDPVYVEAAQGLARRVMTGGGAGAAARAAFAVRVCLARPATDSEVTRLVALYADAKARYAKTPEKATQFATVPLGPLPGGVDAAEAAAWTVVGSVLLNLDEMFMKR